MNNDQPREDRGTKKWTTMMLPEHKEQLKDMWEHKKNEARPYFDEQQLEEFSKIVVHAYSENLPVQLVYCRSEIFKEKNIHTIIDVITEINPRLHTIIVEDKCIYIKDLLDIQLADSSF